MIKAIKCIMQIRQKTRKIISPLCLLPSVYPARASTVFRSLPKLNCFELNISLLSKIENKRSSSVLSKILLIVGTIEVDLQIETLFYLPTCLKYTLLHSLDFPATDLVTQIH